MIRPLNLNEFEEAINFANKIFFEKNESNLKRLQPKVYNYPKDSFANHFVAEQDNKIVGLFGTYRFAYQGLNFLGIGTVCVDPNYRNQGIMKKMFEYIDKELVLKNDIFYLMGNKKRYEHFGFYKTGQKITFRIKQNSLSQYVSNLKLVPYLKSNSLIDKELFDLYQRSEPKRNIDNFYDALISLANEVYLIMDEKVTGYLIYERKTNTIKEMIVENGEIEKVLNSLILLIKTVDIFYEVSIDNKDISKLYELSDNYQIANITNFKVVNYLKVIETLLALKGNLKKGKLMIKIIDEICLKIIVDKKVTVTEVFNENNFDLVISQKEAHQIFFDNPYFYQKKINKKATLINSFFPLTLPASISSVESF